MNLPKTISLSAHSSNWLSWVTTVLTTLLMNAMFDDFKEGKKKNHMFHNLNLTLCKIVFKKKLY
jgi:hypothetical protein